MPAFSQQVFFLMEDDASPVPEANIFSNYCNHMIFYDETLPVAPPVAGSRRQDLSRLRDRLVEKLLISNNCIE